MISNIDGTFPTAGVDQPSQGFRDNFAAAKNEIEALQNAKIDISGGTMTGLLTLSGDPTTSFGAATKQYVDASTGISLQNVVEDTTPALGGNLDVQGSKITNSLLNGDIVLQPNGIGLVVAQVGYDMSAGPDEAFASKEYVDTQDATAGVSNIVEDLTPELGGELDALSNKIINVGSPTVDGDVANKLYVDGVAAGLGIKESVRAATTANITLSGTQTVDTVLLIAGDRVLVKDQTLGQENGIYDVNAGAWTRSSDADNAPAGEVTTGMFTFVEEGGQIGTGYVLITADPITLDTTVLEFAQFSDATVLISSVNSQTGIVLLDADDISDAATTNKYTTAGDITKLADIEASAAADQTAADIRILGFFDVTNDGAGSLLDADLLDGNEATAFATSAQGTLADNALKDIVEDVTPQLGGDLDVQAFSIITSTANTDIELVPTGTGRITGPIGYDVTGNADEVLANKGYVDAQITTSGGISLQNIVEDLTPQLGGNLDVQAFELTTSTLNGDIVFNPPGTGIITGPVGYDVTGEADEVLANKGYVDGVLPEAAELLTVDQGLVFEHLRYDPDTDRLITNRVIFTKLNSFLLGEQWKISSGGEQVYFKSTSTGLNHYPSWGGVADQSIVANQDETGIQHPSIRTFADNVVFDEPLGTFDTVSNAVPYQIALRAPTSASTFSIEIIVEENIIPTDWVAYEVFFGTDNTGTKIYLQHVTGLTKVPGDTLKIDFEQPIDRFAGQQIFAQFVKKPDQDGTPTVLQVRQTGGISALALHYDFVTTPDLLAEPTTPVTGPTLSVTRSGVATRVNPAGFIEDMAVDTARFDFDPTTLASKGLLIERPATNIALQSETLDVAPWVVTSAALDVTANDAIDPRGTSTATLLTDNSAASLGGLQQDITVPIDTLFRGIGVFVKKTTGETSPTFMMKVQYVGGTPSVLREWGLNTDTGEMSGTGNQGAEDFGDYWRLTGIHKQGGGENNTTLRIQIFPAFRGHDPDIRDNDPIEDVTVTGSAHAWGLHVETATGALVEASSYIPTTTVPVARGTELISTTDMSWLNAGTDHTLYVEYMKVFPIPDLGIIQIDDGTNNDVMAIEGLFGVGDRFLVGGTDLGSISSGNSDSINRAAFALADGDQAAVINGSAPITGTVTGAGFPASADMTTLRIGNRADGTDPFVGWIREIRYYNVRKSDQFLEDLSNGLLRITGPNNPYFKLSRRAFTQTRISDREHVRDALLGEDIAAIFTGEVEFFADLPFASTVNVGQLWRVRKRTTDYWAQPVTARFLAGYYESDGTNWLIKPNAALPTFDIVQGDDFTTPNYRNFTPSDVTDIYNDSIHGLNRDPASVAVGIQALQATTTATDNVAVGWQAMSAHTTGTRNAAVGFTALATNTTQSDNTALGFEALKLATADGNTAVGSRVLSAATVTGSNNTAIGASAMLAAVTGADNTAVGVEALAFLTSGLNNVAVGRAAGRLGTTAKSNVAIGHFALETNISGDDNVAIGEGAGSSVITGSRNIMIGKDTTMPTDVSDMLNIGNTLYANFATGNVGINKQVPNYKLDVNGSFGFTPGTSVTPIDNGDVVFEFTSNTSFTIKAKGTDGVVRSGTITLS